MSWEQELGKAIQASVAELEIVKLTRLGRAQFSLEQREHETTLIFDLFLGRGSGAVERYEIPFGSPEALQGFVQTIVKATSGLEIATKLPDAGPIQ